MCLEHVELGVSPSRPPAAFVTGSVDFQPVSGLAEAMSRRHRRDHLGDLGSRKFGQRPALATDQVIVLGIAVVVFKDVPPVGPGGVAEPPLGRWLGLSRP